MEKCVLAIALCLIAASPAFAQTKMPLEGVWKITEVRWPRPQPEGRQGIVTNSQQPSLMIFTRGYYSFVEERGGGRGSGKPQPRTAAAAAKDPQQLTDAEKIARFEEWRPFSASTGTYQINGSTLIKRAMVAKNVRVMTRGTPTIWEFKLEGPNTLWLIPTGDLATTEPDMKLTRLE